MGGGAVGPPPILFPMQRFRPSFLDRLILQPDATRRAGSGLNLQEVKSRLVRDLESLLNTRRPRDGEFDPAYERSAQSVLNFGLSDLSAFSLASPENRRAISEALEMAIVRHEPRLKQVQVTLADGAGPNGRLQFQIHAYLQLNELREPVNFDAMLNPISRHCEVFAR